MNSKITTRRTFLQQLTALAAAASVGHRWSCAAEATLGVGLRPAMDRSAQCCLAWLNPKQAFLPTGGYELAHDTGRWWDAMLRYETATGTRIPEWAETAMLGNLRTLTDNPAALLMNSARLPGPEERIKVNPHNLRETLLAYTALIRFRKDDWARAQGLRLIETMAALLEPDGQMDYEGLARVAGGPLTADPLMIQRAPAGEWFNATGTTGRALEAVVEFHEATGDPKAGELAQRLAAVHLRQAIDPAGAVRAELRDPAHVGHTHSYCGTLRGLLRHGFATKDRAYIDAVAATYRRGLWGTAISHSGWTPHDQGRIRFPNKDGEPIGEHASCGDVAQIALWLALQDGQTELLDDVERLIRARLLPSQIGDAENPRRDGAWGVYGHPFGYGAILDVFAAVLHSLADFQEHIITTPADGVIAVNLHFDRETSQASIRAHRAAEATLWLTPKQPGEWHLRVPGWAARESVRLSVESPSPLAARALPLRWQGSYLVIPHGEANVGDTVILKHDLPTRQTIEEMPVSGRKFALTWRGDDVAACDPQVPIYPAK